MVLFLILFMVFFFLFVIPFVMGFHPNGSQWVLKPQKYLTLYLLKVCDIGNEFYKKVFEK